MTYKAETWMNGGKWHCADCRDLKNGSSDWYIPCRLLNMSPKEFAEMLIVDFDAEVNLTYHQIYNQETKEFSNGKRLLLFEFDSQEKAEKYKAFINKKARGINFSLGN